MIYTYIRYSPNLNTLTDNILKSDMENKDLLYCTWDEVNNTFDIAFSSELSSSDKEKLDILVSGT